MTDQLNLNELEAVALRGIEAREQLLVSQIAAAKALIDADLAVLYGTVEARLALEAGAILTGKWQIQNGKLIPVEQG